MGRELKRVPLDFDWPLNQVWRGFINPHYEKCNSCNGLGTTTARQRLEDLVSLIMLSGENSINGRCHPYFNSLVLYNTAGIACSKDMAELTTGLAGREPSFFGHDACDKWSATKKILLAAGLSEDWGTCTVCDGHGIPKDKYELYEAWESEDPPSGDGYQIWETVSEGSPISPVFATPEELARHMAETKWGADRGSSYETWMKFINGPGWCPSMIMDANGIHTGAESVNLGSK